MKTDRVWALVAVEVIAPFNVKCVSLPLNLSVMVPPLPAKTMGALLATVVFWVGEVWSVPPPWIVKVPVSFQVVRVPTLVVLLLSIVKVLPGLMVVSAAADWRKARKRAARDRGMVAFMVRKRPQERTAGAATL